MTDVKTVVVDEGSAQIKVCWFDEETQEIQQHVMPSNITFGYDDHNDGTLTDGNYQLGKTKYAVFSEGKERMKTDTPYYQFSTENMILVHEALRQAGFGGQKLDVIATLPVDQFYNEAEGGRNNKNVDEKKEKLMTQGLVNRNDLPLAEIVSCRVSSESIPAWYNLVVTDSLERDKSRSKADRIMIVDIGGTTTDITLITGVGQFIDRTTVRKGVFDITAQIRKNVGSLGIETVTDEQMDYLLRNKQLRKKDVSTEIQEAILPVKQAIVTEMRRFESDPGSLDAILYVGGGSALFGEALMKEYAHRGDTENAILPEKPEIYVARGLLKYDLYDKLRQQQKQQKEKST